LEHEKLVASLTSYGLQTIVDSLEKEGFNSVADILRLSTADVEDLLGMLQLPFGKKLAFRDYYAFMVAGGQRAAALNTPNFIIAKAARQCTSPMFLSVTLHRGL